jgi:polyhydroxybutyrate depolymerase
MKNYYLATVILGLPFVLACGSSSPSGGGGTGGDPSSGCSEHSLAQGTFSLTHDGVQYGYDVHLPPGYTGTKAMPLILNWHGLTSNAGQQASFSAMNPVADAEGFVVVYPNSPDASWNAGTCCAFNATTRDDVGFARALVNEITSKGCIDRKRVYAMGMSNGGFMSHRLACEAADLFAAVGPVAGKVGIANCAPSRPVPVLHFHGTADGLVAYDSAALSAEGLNVPDTLARWATRNGCQQQPSQTFVQGTATCQTWTQCSGDSEVRLCTSQDMGHCWPGQLVCPFGAVTDDIDASQEIAKFFKRFSLP